jgi:hypothetical protein
MSRNTALRRCDQVRRNLAGLFVGPMAPTPAAVLVELDPLPIVVTIFRRYVVSPLAFGALERHMDAPITGHSSPLKAFLGRPISIAARRTRAERVFGGRFCGGALGGSAGGAAEGGAPEQSRPIRAPVHPGGGGEHRDRVSRFESLGAGNLVLEGLPDAGQLRLGGVAGRRRRRSRRRGVWSAVWRRRSRGTLRCAGAPATDGGKLCPSGSEVMIDVGAELVHRFCDWGHPE